MRNIIMISIFLFCALAMAGQKAELVSAPVQGHTTKTSIKVWFMLKGVEDVRVGLGTDMQQAQKISLAGSKSWKGNVPVTVEFKNLEPGTKYELQIRMDDDVLAGTFPIRTTRSKIPETWSFMAGSCHLMGTGLLKLIKPGRYTKIFDEMMAISTDFFLWLGDNVYLLTGEWNSERRTFEKYTKVRIDPKVNEFMRSRPQYAILDDHDFGPDNGDGSFAGKDLTTDCYKSFWPNPYHGTADAPATFSHFSHHDADFFLLDDRYFKIEDAYTQILGPKQMDWLKKRLKASTATFKFLALGSQWLSEVNERETFADYEERKVLFDFIREEQITGIVLLSGDRHFTELMKLEQEGMYPLYEFTNSPLTSIVRKQPLKEKDVEHINPLRIEGTMVCAHNFGLVKISGPEDARICTMKTFGSRGELLWKYEIEAKDLEFPR